MGKSAKQAAKAEKRQYLSSLASAQSPILSVPERVKYSPDQERDDHGRFAGGATEVRGEPGGTYHIVDGQRIAGPLSPEQMKQPYEVRGEPGGTYHVVDGQRIGGPLSGYRPSGGRLAHLGRPDTQSKEPKGSRSRGVRSGPDYRGEHGHIRSDSPVSQDARTRNLVSLRERMVTAAAQQGPDSIYHDMIADFDKAHPELAPR